MQHYTTGFVMTRRVRYDRVSGTARYVALRARISGIECKSAARPVVAEPTRNRKLLCYNRATRAMREVDEWNSRARAVWERRILRS